MEAQCPSQRECGCSACSGEATAEGGTPRQGPRAAPAWGELARPVTWALGSEGGACLRAGTPFACKYSGSCPGAWGFDAVSVASVGRAGTAKNVAARCSTVNGPFQEAESFLLQEVLERELDPCLSALLGGIGAGGGGGCLGLYWLVSNLPSRLTSVLCPPHALTECPGWG